MSDPFYDQILERLAGHLDPDVFEACVCDLLRDTFPGLVPIPGGSDRGMDGAVADGQGEAFPLVATTAEDVSRNLRGSLKRYSETGGTRKRAVLVTSQSLTAAKRFKLQEEARGLSITLVQICDRQGLADRLYGDSRWCRDLLQLSGRPSALSIVPKSRRPLIDLEPVGREADLQWLRSTTGDRVLVGEPGSGKTFLLYKLAREGKGLFLVDTDREAIANALRELDPESVFVDDAQLDPDIVLHLRQLRSDGQEFDIVASTWRGEQDKVIDALGVPSSSVLQLELLTRNQILEVYKSRGVETSATWMRHLVDQAANKPGLAITLAELWLRGDYEDLINGKALSRSLMTVFEDRVGGSVREVLAAFSLGGDRGMPMTAVADVLNRPLVDLRHFALGLAAGGVLAEAPEDALSVAPWQLRAALVREVFFDDTPSLNRLREPLLEVAPDRDSSLHTIILAGRLGAKLPGDWLREEVLASRSRRVLEAYAGLGESEAMTALDHDYGSSESAVRAALNAAPGPSCYRTLQLAEERANTNQSFENQFVQLLSKWVGCPNIEDSIERRKVLAASVLRFLGDGGDRGVAADCLAAVLSAELEASEPDPGMGERITISRSRLPASRLPDLDQMLENVASTFDELREHLWGAFSPVLWDWQHPGPALGKNAENYEALSRAFCAKLLVQLAKPLGSAPGFAARIGEIAADLGIRLRVNRDPVFEAIYLPPRTPADAANREAQRASHEKAVEALARRWAREAPSKIAGILARYEQEAHRAGLWSPPWNAMPVSQALALRVEAPEVWFDELVASGVGGALGGPFLERAVCEKRPGWDDRLRRCLETDQLMWNAARVVLSMPSPENRLFELTLRRIDRKTNLVTLVNDLSSSQEIPLPTLRKLLQRPNPLASLAAAVGEWHASDEPTVRPEIEQDWRAAIVRSSDPTDLSPLRFWLGTILGSDRALALDWLRARVARPEEALQLQLFDETCAGKRAIRALSMDQRRTLLQEIKEESAKDELIRSLVDRDPETYKTLLTRTDLKKTWTAPLHGMPDQAWAELASLALLAGVSEDSIVDESFAPPMTISGSGVEHWQQWARAFEDLAAHSNTEIQEVARRGLDEAQRRIEAAEESWKRTQIRGF